MEQTVEENKISIPFLDITELAFSVAAENEAGVGEFSSPITYKSVHFELGELN